MTAQSSGRPPGSAGQSSLGACLLSLALIALGAFVAYDALTLEVNPSYARIGPRVFPIVIAVGLISVGALLFLQGLRKEWFVVFMTVSGADEAGRTKAAPAARLLLVVLGLVLDVVLIRPAGFIVASTVLYVCTTKAFGSRRIVIDLAAGLAMSVVIYMVFNHFLKVRLPAGWLWGF